ncbi:MAG: S8 family serine peptidase, partial [Candidatus Bathyarchaeota archaeon]
MKRPMRLFFDSCLSLVFFLLWFNVFCMGIYAQVWNDPLLSQQWGWYRIGADKALVEEYSGAGVVVAVLDTGIDLDHPDLANNIVEGWNFVDDNGDVSDLDMHGSMVSGIIAAVANNELGLVGVAPKTKIMPLKVLDSNGGNIRDIASAIRYAADNGAKIITMSFAGQYSRFSISTERAIDYAYRQGCVLVAAAGNNNTDDLVFPASYDQVIAVSAIDQNDLKAEFSNFGSYVDFCAPGVN